MEVVANYYACADKGVQFFGIYLPGTGYVSSYSGTVLPTGVTLSSVYGGIVTGFFVDADVVITGDYTFYLQTLNRSNPITVKVKLSMSVCGLVYDNCCDDEYNIIWLTRQGGYANYLFSGKRTFNVRIGDTPTYKDSGLIISNSRVDDVYSGRIISTSNIPQSHSDYIDSLKYSIKAWHRTSEGDLDILVDKGNFTRYTSDQKFYDVSLQFIYAEQLLIQTA